MAARQANGATGTMNVALRQQAAVLSSARGAMGLTATEGLNLSRQFTDIGVTAAMGMNPLMIAIQQGPQILDTFQMAAQRTGTSVKAVMLQAGAAIWTAMAPLLPFIAAAAAAAAVVGGSLALATRAMNEEAGDLTKGLGLTADQLENVQNKGVTMGDVVVGSLRYLQDVIWDQIGPSVTKIGDWFSQAMDVATRALVSATKAITGGFIGSFRAIRAVWGQLPAVIGDLAVGAANATIRAVEGMINGAVRGINTVLAAARALGAINPAFRSANQISDFTLVDLTEMNNPNAGAARAAGRTMAAEYAAGMADGASMVDRQLAALGASIRGAAERRILREAGEGEESANRGGAGRQAREVAQVMAQVSNVNLQPLNAVVEMVNPLRTVADEMRLIDTLAQDTARGLASAFGESGRALGDLLTVMSGYQSRMAEISLAESEFRLSGAQADRERAMAQVQNYGDMLGAAKGFFKEGSDGYKALQAAEQAYRVFQFAMMIQSMVMGGTETAATVGQNAIKAASHGVVAVARAIASLPFPFNIAAGAATIAALAAIGVRVAGGGSGGGRVAGTGTGFDAGSVDQARGQAQSAQSGRTSFAGSVAQSVRVVVTADRDGLNAYVADTARSEAAGVAGPMVANSERRMAKALPAQVNRGIARGSIGEPVWGAG
jgi:hypothetical protein